MIILHFRKMELQFKLIKYIGFTMLSHIIVVFCECVNSRKRLILIIRWVTNTFWTTISTIEITDIYLFILTLSFSCHYLNINYNRKPILIVKILFSHIIVVFCECVNSRKRIILIIRWVTNTFWSTISTN